jgi:hypothetical protein
VLLEGQSVRVERPLSSSGTAIGAAGALFAIVVAVALLARALSWPASFPQFLAYLGAAVTFFAAAAFAFWTWAGATMRYAVGAQGVTIRWGWTKQHIPAAGVAEITQGRADARPRIDGISWSGYHVGRGETEGIGPVVFYSTHRDPEDIVYVRTSTVTYGVSPRDPARFASELQEIARYAREGADTEGLAPAVERELPASHPVWSDRVCQALILAAVLANVVLWGFVLAFYPSLDQTITIEFPPIGDITTFQSRSEILKIPAAATAVLVLNLAAGLLVQARERAATYLILSGTVFFQGVFWVAAVTAIANA